MMRSATLFLLSVFLLASETSAQSVCIVCGCSTCPDTFRVGNPDAIFVIPDEFRSISFGASQAECSLIETVGLESLIPDEFCNDALRLRQDFRTTCGCPAVPTSAPAVATTNTPVMAPTTGMPVMAAPTGNIPSSVQFILVHAPTNTELVILQDKDVIDLDDLLDADAALEFNLKVQVPDTIPSVQFVSPTDRFESARPFSLCGDDSGDYETCDDSILRIGKTTKVTVTPNNNGSHVSISFKLMAASSSMTTSKEKNRRDRGERGEQTRPSPPVMAPSASPCDPNALPPILGKVDLLILLLNQRIAKTGFPSLQLDFVAADAAPNGSCALQIHFGMHLETKIFDNDNVQLGGSGILTGIAVQGHQWCVENLQVTELTPEGPLGSILLGVIERNVFQKTVSEVITGVLEDRFDFCI